MLAQTYSLTRSKSDNQIHRSKVLSPTPIKEQSVCFLNQICKLNSFQRKLDALEREEPETHFIIRKFQSLNTFNMEQRCLERLYSNDSQKSGAGLLGDQFDDQLFHSSDYPMPEIPTRTSNPLIYDSRFKESADADSDEIPLDVYGNNHDAEAIQYTALVQH